MDEKMKQKWEMSLEWFDKCTREDFQNGATISAIRDVIKRRDALYFAARRAFRELLYLSEQVKAREGGSVQKVIEELRGLGL